jgi:hypothetical protein
MKKAIVNCFSNFTKLHCDNVGGVCLFAMSLSGIVPSSSSAVGGGNKGPVYQLSCDNEVRIVRFRYNFLIHNIFERINGEIEKLVKVRHVQNCKFILNPWQPFRSKK